MERVIHHLFNVLGMTFSKSCLTPYFRQGSLQARQVAAQRSSTSMTVLCRLVVQGFNVPDALPINQPRVLQHRRNYLTIHP